MARRDAVKQSFSAGFVCSMAVYSLVQDVVGKDTYLRWASENWTTAWITAPLALAALMWSLYRFRSAEQEQATA